METLNPRHSRERGDPGLGAMAVPPCLLADLGPRVRGDDVF